ncbi:MAG: SMI1/KNR4 family protein [Planctomycetota bacterium]
MKTPTTKAGKPTSWSRLIESKFCCRLSPDLIDWFDSEIWREQEEHAPPGQFVEAVSPEELLVDAPSAIWPALMPCDLLPLVGNSMGDWLCLRMATDGSASEVVYWYHGGGDWITWGNGLAQALLFAHVRKRLPQGDRGYGPIATESNELLATKFASWATHCVVGARGIAGIGMR